MTNAYRDENHVPTILAVSNADGTTLLNIQAETVHHSLKVDDGVGGAGFTHVVDPRDDNRVTVLMAASSTDGVTPVPLYIDSVTNKLLIKST